MEVLSALQQININPTIEQLTYCNKLIDEHLKWNTVFNLSGHRSFFDVLHYQIVDSLNVSNFIRKGRLLDIGTGAGFPGLPLAIFHPKTHFILLDSNAKKLAFAHQIKAIFKLKNVTIIHDRIESLAPDMEFDQIISRAFTNLNGIINLSLSRLSPDGEILAMKGVQVTDELKYAQLHHKECNFWIKELPEIVNKKRMLAIVRQGKL